MKTTLSAGDGLVPIANLQTLLLSVRYTGLTQGPPRWIQCTALGDEHAPAWRISVVRASDESCESLWLRVIDTIRQLKCVRGLMHRVDVDCMHTPPPARPMHEDLRFNAQCALWSAAGDPDPMVRVEALGALWEVACQRPALH